MPTYGYKCAKCDHEFEIRQSMSEAALTVCPKELCGQKKWGRGKVKRQISTGGGLLFKGSGFYITDYRSEKYKESAKKDTTAATTPASTTATPAAAPASTPAAAPAAAPAKPAKAAKK